MEVIKPGYQRVTDILSPQSGYGSVPVKILKAACDRGTRVHDAIENYFKGLGLWHDDEWPEEVAYIESFEKFWQEWDFTALENRFYCDELMITGKCDLIIKHEGKPILVDWKTSAAVNPTWQYQGAAYKHLAKDYGIEEVWFVKLSKTGEYPEVVKFTAEQCNRDIAIFRKCIEIYHAFHAKKKQINYEDI
jgi:hypothetical protein